MTLYNYSFGAQGFAVKSKGHFIDEGESELHLPPIPQSPPKPEITILCIKCEEEIKVRNLKEHQEFHNALEMFRFSVDSKPTSVKQLVKRRRAIVKRLNEAAHAENPVPVKKLHKLNLAYELLKADVEGTASTLRDLDKFYSPHVKGQGTNLSCALAFGICQDANSRWKTSMEDRYAYKDCFCNDPRSGFFSIFDGYCGGIAAEKCARYLGEILEEKVERIYRTSVKHEYVDAEIVDAFNEAFEEMDNILLLGVAERSRNRWSGCSAVACLLRGKNLYVANAGDIRAVLCRGDGSMERLSHNQSPWDKKERHRVRKAKGEVTKSEKTALVNGLLKSTRGLGNHGDPNLKVSVITKPAVNCVTLEEMDQFLILASNGVWEVFSEEEVILLLEDLMPDLDVKAVVKRMQERASALGTGMPPPKWDNIPMRDKGGAPSQGSSPDEVLNRPQVCQSSGNSSYRDKSCKEYSREESEASSEHDKEEGTDSTSRQGENILETDSESSSQSPTKKASTADRDASQHSDMKVDTSSIASEENPALLAPPVPTITSRGSQLVRNEKASALAKALSERLVEGAILAGSRDNITVSVVLLNGCPLQMFLLPAI